MLQIDTLVCIHKCQLQEDLLELNLWDFLRWLAVICLCNTSPCLGELWECEGKDVLHPPSHYKDEEHGSSLWKLPLGEKVEV